MKQFKNLIIWVCLLLLFFCVVADRGFASKEIPDEYRIDKSWRDFKSEADRVELKGAFPYMECFRESAKRHGLPLALLLAVARGESNFDKNAASSASCYGIMQIQWPGTAKDLGIYQRSDLYKPCVNIDAGAKYLAWLARRYDENYYLTLAAYNYGPGKVKRGSVPDGAKWYAQYIYDHLEKIRKKGFRGTDRILLLEFTYYRTAKSFLERIEEKIPDGPFEIFKSRTYSYDIYLMYANSKERDRYLRLYREKMGLEPIETKS